jgi:hypothetical protein
MVPGRGLAKRAIRMIDEHRGIRFSVKKIGSGQWHWEIFPPECVLGLHRASGEVEGEMAAATQMAMREIDAQSGGPEVKTAPSPSRRASSRAQERTRLGPSHAASD